MLNKFQKDPAEFKRLVGAISEYLTVAETQDVLNADIYAFAKALNVPSVTRRSVTAARIKARLEHSIPELPHFDKDDIPRIHTCDGCRDIADVAGLRWAKLNRGEPVTWSIDRTSQPHNAAAFTDREIHNWFLIWAAIQGNRVVKAPKGQKGDCHIAFKRIDGPGKVMGFVYQPRGNAEFMSLSGDLSGDMFIDNSERSYPVPRTRTFGYHEGGHFFGLQHSEDINDLLYKYLIGDDEKPPQAGDISQYKQRYISQRLINA